MQEQENQEELNVQENQNSKNDGIEGQIPNHLTDEEIQKQEKITPDTVSF